MDSKTVCVYIAVVTLFCAPCLVTSESEHAMVTQGACPYPCTQGGHHYCYPLPCPLPPCAYPVKDAGACCSHCPTGKSEHLYSYKVSVLFIGHKLTVHPDQTRHNHHDFTDCLQNDLLTFDKKKNFMNFDKKFR